MFTQGKFIKFYFMNYDKFTQNVEEKMQKNVIEGNDDNFSANSVAI